MNFKLFTNVCAFKMFKFAFQQNDEDPNEFGINDNDTANDEDEDLEYEAPFEEIHAKPSQLQKPIISNVIYRQMTFAGDQQVQYVRVSADEEEFLLDIKENHTDLIPGVYEGGGKIWECTQDLGDYFVKPTNGENSIFKSVAEKYVLDLGCGAGLLRILALKVGAYVHFSDYNSAILSNLTIENVLLNFQQSKEKIIKRCKFYAGDWSKYVENTIDNNKYDVILTSETIYNPENNWKILNVFKSKLKNDGVALVAAKSYYFGVGGGCRDFEKLIKDDGHLESENVLIVTENVQREILKVKFVNKSKP